MRSWVPAGVWFVWRGGAGAAGIIVNIIEHYFAHDDDVLLNYHSCAASDDVFNDDQNHHHLKPTTRTNTASGPAFEHGRVLRQRHLVPRNELRELLLSVRILWQLRPTLWLKHLSGRIRPVWKQPDWRDWVTQPARPSVATSGATLVVNNYLKHNNGATADTSNVFIFDLIVNADNFNHDCPAGRAFAPSRPAHKHGRIVR